LVLGGVLIFGPRIVIRDCDASLSTGSDARAHLPAHGRDHRDPCLALHLLRKRSSSRNAGGRRVRKERSTLPIENQSFVSGGEGVFTPAFSFPGFDSIPGVILAKHRPKFPTALRGLGVHLNGGSLLDHLARLLATNFTSGSTMRLKTFTSRQGGSGSWNEVRG
jgi:hypothetical protein